MTAAGAYYLHLFCAIALVQPVKTVRSIMRMYRTREKMEQNTFERKYTNTESEKTRRENDTGEEKP